MAGRRAGWVAFEEIREGRIRDSSFVVQLWYVHRGCPGGGWDCVDERYRDPVKFFDRTYFSDGLRLVLSNVARRLVYGGEGNAVVLLHTGFGGGKSHTLLSIYHLARNLREAARSGRLRGFLESIGVSLDEAGFRSAVAVFDGAAIDPIRLRESYRAPNVWVFILEELARSVGSGELLKRIERYRKVVPGNEEIGEIFARLEEAGVRPVVLIDEIAMYLRNLEVRGDRAARREAEGLRIFLHNLTVAASNSRYAVVAIATPQQYESESQQVLAALSDVKRVAMPASIVGRGDAAAVLKAALLESIDENAAKGVAGEYFSLYERERDRFPLDASMPEYRRRMAESYPFHPFLVDVLYSELAEAPGFQGTRDILRIVAWALYWRARGGDVYDMLVLGDIDATRKEILDELLTRNEYLRKLRSAVSYDIEIVEEIDERLAEEGLPRVASLTYSSVLVRSAADKPSRIEEVLLGTATPLRGVSTQLVRHMLESELLEKTAHLHRIERGGEVLYIVKSRANVYMLLNRIAKEILSQSFESVHQKLMDEIRKRVGNASGCKVVIWPSHPGQVEDSPVVKLVLLDPRKSEVAVGGERLLGLLERFTLYSQAGTGAAYRKHRNTVLYLVPDIRIYNQLLNNMARLLASERLLQPEQKQYYGLERADEDELNKIRSRVINEIVADMSMLYTTLYYPYDVRPDGSVVFEKTELDPAIIRREGLWGAVREKLKEIGKLVADIAEDYVLNEVVVKRYEALKRPLSVEDVVSAFTEDPSSVILLNPRRIIVEKLASLVEKGRLVALTHDEAICMRRPPLASGETRFAPCSSEEAGQACIVASGAEGLECRPKPPPGCAKPVWDVDSREWKCDKESLAIHGVEEKPPETGMTPTDASATAPMLPASFGAKRRPRLQYNNVNPYELREKLIESEQLDKPVEAFSLRLVLSGTEHVDERLVSGTKVLLQALKEIATKARNYSLEVSVRLRSQSRVSTVTIDAEASTLDQVNRLLDISRSLGKLVEARLDLTMNLREGEPLQLRDIADALNRRLLAKYPGLRLYDTEIELGEG